MSAMSRRMRMVLTTQVMALLMSIAGAYIWLISYFTRSVGWVAALPRE